jgi:protein involved in polysaccharide export with SLBB domain
MRVPDALALSGGLSMLYDTSRGYPTRGNAVTGRFVIERTVAGFAALTLVLLLAACADSAPRAGAGSAPAGAGTVASADRLKAERTVYASLTQGAERYRLAPGDTLLFLFTGRARAQQSNYVIGVRDKLRVEFFYHQDASRTVVVRPDGRITLPLQGDVVAAGLTPEQLATRIRAMYQDVYRDPVVTVSVEEFSSALTELSDALKTSVHGRARQIVVGPDGMADVPLLPPIKASGRSIEEVQDEVNRLYEERFGGVRVSVSLEKIVGDRVFVFGEVRSPGMLTLARPLTALQIISSVGGPLTTGAMNRVKVLYSTGDGEPQLRTLDLEAMLQGRKFDQDMLLGANTVVYVPPTTITQLDRIVDQYIKQLFLYNGSSLNFDFVYSTNTQRVTAVPP